MTRASAVRTSSAGHDVPLFVHGHEDFYELVTVLDGSAEHIVDGERSVTSKGDVFVIGNGISHGFDNTHGLRVCNIMYRPEMLFSGDMDIRKIPGFHALFLLEPYFSSTQHFQSRLRLTHADFALVMPLLERAESEYTSDLPGRNTMVLARAAACCDTPAVADCQQKPREISGMAGRRRSWKLPPLPKQCRLARSSSVALLAAALYPAVRRRTGMTRSATCWTSVYVTRRQCFATAGLSVI